MTPRIAIDNGHPRAILEVESASKVSEAEETNMCRDRRKADTHGKIDTVLYRKRKAWRHAPQCSEVLGEDITTAMSSPNTELPNQSVFATTHPSHFLASGSVPNSVVGKD